jgi:signal peptidase II
MREPPAAPEPDGPRPVPPAAPLEGHRARPGAAWPDAGVSEAPVPGSAVPESAVPGPAVSGSAVSGPLVRRGPSRRLVALLVAIAATALLLDQITKIIVVATLSNRAPVVLIPSVLELELTRNSGAAFSVATGGTILFSLVAIVIVGVIARVTRTLRSLPWAVVLGLVLGGALGNLSDRILRAPSPLRGHVVDWIYLHHWPIFNLADSSIVIGGVIAVVLSVRGVGLGGPVGPAGPTGPATGPRSGGGMADGGGAGGAETGGQR